MTLETRVVEHYAMRDLQGRITDGLRQLGVDPDAATPDDLKPVDEFHIGGVGATRDLIAQLEITPQTNVLDIGSGLGGTARFVASQTGARVVGLDLTDAYVATATALSRMVGMESLTRFSVGSAIDMPFEADEFDLALLLHVGMNIRDKLRLMTETARVLRSGATFAIYDVMKTGSDPIEFPVPWAETPENSFVEGLEEYREAARTAGFSDVSARDRSEMALAFFADQKARMEAEGPPALGIHLLLGETRAEKIANMVKAIATGRIAPTELILRRA